MKPKGVGICEQLSPSVFHRRADAAPQRPADRGRGQLANRMRRLIVLFQISRLALGAIMLASRRGRESLLCLIRPDDI
jgi:hypothetical protein